MPSCDCEDEARGVERRTLVLLLAVNAAMFAVELVAGFLADSMALVADSLDMLADAGVYGAALWAVGTSQKRKATAAKASGIVQMGLAAGVIIEVVRKAIVGSDPVSGLMIAVSCLALGANTFCVFLLRKHRHGDVHLRASWIFSVTDVQANLGVIAAGFLVMLTRSALPDLLIGLVVSGNVLRGGVRILREARASEGDERRSRLERDMERLLETAPPKDVGPAVLEAVKGQFAETDRSAVIKLLSRYGAESSPAGRERVQLAILKLSGGSVREVRENVKLALLDYRDVLYSAESRR